MKTRNPDLYRWQCTRFDLSLLSCALGDDFLVEAGSHRESKLQLYDSFDRGFISAGAALIRSNARFRVVSANDLLSDPIESGKLVRHQRPVFYWDFEPGSFRQNLRKRLKLRAAVQLAEISVDHQQYLVRNVDGKIILRLHLETARVAEDVVASTLIAAPLLGYEAEAKILAKRVSSVPEFCLAQVSLAPQVLETLGMGARPLSPKDAIQLQADQSVQDAVTEIAKTMVRVARQNEPGIIDDIDTEYLHDYRVAIRKLRSVITLIKGAYPNDVRRRMKNVLGDFSRATNRLRDLDVYLLQEEQYRERLPECLRPGLDRMFADLRAERARVIGKTMRYLQSAEYMESMMQQYNWLSRSELPKGPNAELRIGAMVEQEITRHYKRVRKMGMRLNADTPDAKVHELRIECKKLRYLLELFVSLFEEQKMKPILRRLRGLQDVLGDFNDYSVQMESIMEYLGSAKDLEKDSTAAVGGLIAVLYDKQLQARGQVAEKFGEFSDGKMRARFKALFTNLKGSGK